MREWWSLLWSSSKSFRVKLSTLPTLSLLTDTELFRLFDMFHFYQLLLLETYWFWYFLAQLAQRKFIIFYPALYWANFSNWLCCWLLWYQDMCDCGEHFTFYFNFFRCNEISVGQTAIFTYNEKKSKVSLSLKINFKWKNIYVAPRKTKIYLKIYFSRIFRWTFCFRLCTSCASRLLFA